MPLFRTSVACLSLLAVVTAESAAQRGTVTVRRGGPGGPAPAAITVDDIDKVSKEILRDIPRAKSQDEALKALEKQFKDEEKKAKETIKSLNAAATARGGTRPNANNYLQTIQDNYIAEVRKVMTEEQFAKFDENVEAYRARVEEKAIKALEARGRGRRGGGGGS